MSTFVVWVLIVTSNSYGSHFAVVDNIASQANCVALGTQAVRDAGGFADFRCTAVRKVKP